MAGGLNPIVGLCQTSDLTETSKISNEAVQNKSGEEEKMPEETSVNADSTTHSEAEDTDTTVPKELMQHRKVQKSYQHLNKNLHHLKW